ncbi:MAG: lysostaphin resistance A-like protein [Thermoplasmatota archaeon]
MTDDVRWPSEADAATEEDPTARRHSPGATIWTVLLGLDLGLLALVALGSIFLFLTPGPSAAEATSEGTLTSGALWAQVAFAFVAFTVIPLGWIVGTRVGGWRGALAYLDLGPIGRGTWTGIAWTIAVFVAVGVIAAGYDALGGSTENPQLEQIQSNMTWPLAVALALTAGVGEEILFRGILQKKVGLWGQAVLFGVVHAGYGTVLQVVLPLLLGLFFGLLVQRRQGLWTAIVVHTLFDFVVLASVLVAP